MSTLKPKTQAVLDWIRQCCQIEDVFPTYRDIQDGCGYKSVKSHQFRAQPIYQPAGP